MKFEKEIEKQKMERLGEENFNNLKTLMRIIEYKDSHDVTVEFQDEHKYKTHAKYRDFKIGNIKNPYDKNVCGIGYIGVGEYKSREKGVPTKAYKTWQNMLQRCYDPYYINKEPTYIDCYVCELWHCFQNFAEWYEKEMYECNGEKMQLDKDILYKGNKIYSPETCIFVPQRINSLFANRKRDRGCYPIGVHYNKKANKLQAFCSIREDEKQKIKGLGYFPLNKPFQAFYAYKIFKENYIKQVADEYKTMIPQRLYDALYKYEVEIND